MELYARCHLQHRGVGNGGATGARAPLVSIRAPPGSPPLTRTRLRGRLRTRVGPPKSKYSPTPLQHTHLAHYNWSHVSGTTLLQQFDQALSSLQWRSQGWAKGAIAPPPFF